ncbi:MAG: hypothetical protein V3T90_07020 [Anaerolineae bacterium]
MQHDGGATEHRQGQQFAPAVPDQRAHERLCAFFQARTCQEWEEVAWLDICCEPVYNVVAVRVLERIGATAILRVYVFGPFRVLCDGNPMPSSAWRSPQTRTLYTTCLQQFARGGTEMLVGGFLGAGIGLVSRRSNWRW